LEVAVFDLTGRTALVTGAGQNVGAGIAAALARHGATVVVNDLHGARAQQVVDEINALGAGRALAAPFDVTDLAAVEAAVARIGVVDILVSNAGVGGEHPMAVEPFRRMDPAAWDGPIRVNLLGVMHGCKAVIDGMCERGWGRIITISSGAGTAGTRIAAPTAPARAAASRYSHPPACRAVTANSLALGMMAREPEIDGPGPEPGHRRPTTWGRPAWLL
jgi:3-oxoacyl-[acyl-carrier protein] reductase